MPKRRHTAPASPSSRYAVIHFSRRRTLRSVSPLPSLNDAIGVAVAVGLWATRSVVHQVHSVPAPLKQSLRTVQMIPANGHAIAPCDASDGKPRLDELTLIRSPSTPHRQVVRLAF